MQNWVIVWVMIWVMSISDIILTSFLILDSIGIATYNTCSRGGSHVPLM